MFQNTCNIFQLATKQAKIHTYIRNALNNIGIGLYLYQRKPTPILACALAYTGVARTYERLI